MLSQDLDRHISFHHALGFKFRSQSALLRNFVAFAEARGDQVICADRVLAWAVEAPSPEQRRNRLLQARRFAMAMHAEDSQHEVPSADALGRGLFTRRIPFIYSQEDIRRLMAAAASLAPIGTIRPVTFTNLFGLLAATGMRISEALALRLSDITDDGLVIEKTKFKKSRLLPLHPSTRRALDAYLELRLRAVRASDTSLIGNTGEAVAYPTTFAIFLRLARSIGLRGSSDRGGPRIHDLRHTFAVRSLEQCPRSATAVSRHIVGLSTYLGHAHVTDTYSFARIGAALKMKVEDLRPKGSGWQIRLHEKGGKQHAMPCHHALAEALHAYIAAAGIAEKRKGKLFRTARGHSDDSVRPADEPAGRLADDSPPRCRRRHHGADWQP